jgi:hypothetical protein
MKIFRYSLDVDMSARAQPVQMTSGVVFAVGIIPSKVKEIQLWAEVSPVLKIRRFITLPTGLEISPTLGYRLEYIDTVITPAEEVYHVFEEVSRSSMGSAFKEAS